MCFACRVLCTRDETFTLVPSPKMIKTKYDTSGGHEQTLYLLEQLQIHLDLSLVMDLQADCYVFVICSDYGGVT